MSVDGWNDPQNNPHVYQALKQERESMPFTRILTSTAPREKYHSRGRGPRTVIHWGQRKLLLSEIELLTMVGSSSNPIVYAGAAGGVHLSKLAEMFPCHQFHCYDPAPFNVKTLPNLHTYQVLFTDELAMAYCGKHVIFISDIRALNIGDTANDVAENIEIDMNDQQRWVVLMQPIAALLKFCLSWKPGITTYLDGVIFLPVFGPFTTTESRLLVICNPTLARPNHALNNNNNNHQIDVDTKKTSNHVISTNTERNNFEHKQTDNSTAVTTIAGSDGFMLQMREYDNTVYEEQMFYFNTRQRVMLYPHSVKKVPGLDHCYDCASEVHILSEYYKNVLGVPDSTTLENQVLNQLVSNLSNEISSSITESRTLADPNIEKTLRKATIHKRQWIDDSPAHSVAKKQHSQQLLDGTAPHMLVMSSAEKPTCRLLVLKPHDNNTKQIDCALTVGKAITETPQLQLTLKRVLERKVDVYDLCNVPTIKHQQETLSDSGWKRCQTVDGTIIYVHQKNQIFSHKPPAITGWIIRSGNSSSSSLNSNESHIVNSDESHIAHVTNSYWYENAHTNEVSIDVPSKPLYDH